MRAFYLIPFLASFSMATTSAEDAGVKASESDVSGRSIQDRARALDLSLGYEVALAEANREMPDKTPAEDPKPKSEANCGRFSKGTQTIGAFAGGLQAIAGKNAHTLFGGVNGEYFVIDNLSLRGELIGYGIDQHDAENSHGAGVNLFMRWHPLKSSHERKAMFLEGGAGLAEFSGRTPGPVGTDFNFTLHFAFGGTFQVSKAISITIGPRYLHISNAGIHTEARHDGLDSVGGAVGFNVKF